MSSIDQLKSEVERLSNELQQACLEKVQAAEYGLAVLEEKQRLQEQYEELETALDANKQELDCLKEVGFIVICGLFIRKFLFKFSSLMSLGSSLRIEKTNKSFINTLNYLLPAGLRRCRLTTDRVTYTWSYNSKFTTLLIRQTSTMLN